MRTRWKILLGTVGLVVTGILIWVSVVGYSECGNKKGMISIESLLKERERIGSVSISDTSVLDTAPVRGLKVYMKGGDTE